ncbi:MAG TPA: TetR/AcrR family transcriptional regulator [Jatrophihabitantaceae bacterium]|jgi:AcrR family transcriptional regulator
MTEPGWRDCEPLDLSPTLSGALAAFREHGYHGTTVRDVARRVGVTVPALYYHHGSKQGMLVALFDVAMADLLQRVELALADAGVDPQMRFRNIVEAIALHMTYRRDLAMIDSELRYLDPESRAHYVAQRDKVQRLLNKAISDGSKVGIFHVAHPVDTTRALLGMLLAIATWYRADPRLSPTQLAERYVEIALNTVGFTRRPRR